MLNILRVEAINFGQSIDDTNQLSVVRGGGLLMREVILELSVALEKCFPDESGASFHSVSTGGSIGVFLYPAASIPSEILLKSLEGVLAGQDCSVDAPEWLKDALNAFRRSGLGAKVRLLSFGVSVKPVADAAKPEDVSYDKFKAAEQRALSEIRMKQLRQPSVTLTGSSGRQACAWDGLRPASGKDQVRNEPVSESVWQRFEIGRNAKRDGPLFRFFSRELEKVPEAEDKDEEVRKARELLQTLTSGLGQDGAAFPQDLEELCGAIHPACHPTKLAVLYADGNKFGRIVGDNLESVKEYEEWDAALQRSRAKFLASLLNWLNGKRQRGEPMPLEIFLWGGDEVMFAVPADLGLEAVSKFYEFTGDLEWKGKALTHALGLVVCNYKTPIQRIKSLAISLAERVKTQLDESPGRQENAWQYAVLESVDTPTDLDTFFSERYDAASHAMASLEAPSSDFDDLVSEVRAIERQLPRSQLYRIAHQLSRNPTSREAVERFEEVADLAMQELVDQMARVLPQRPLAEEHSEAELASRVLHWAELLDYWPPTARAEETVESEPAIQEEAR
jgi:hypothetical protein